MSREVDGEGSWARRTTYPEEENAHRDTSGEGEKDAPEGGGHVQKRMHPPSLEQENYQGDTSKETAPNGSV